MNHAATKRMHWGAHDARMHGVTWTEPADLESGRASNCVQEVTQIRLPVAESIWISDD
jgi:hypothetical protein